MSIRVSSLCWKVPLPATSKVVLMRLADFANDAGGSIYPAIETVSKECGLSTRSVQGALRALENDGLLVMVKSCKGGRGKTNVYRIDLDKVVALVGSAAVEEAELEAQNPAVHDINPAPAAGFVSGNPANPALNPAGDARNPAPAAPEPLLTVKNPSGRDSHATNSTSIGMNGSGGESDHPRAIVQAFDRLIIEFWGKQAARFGPKSKDAETAAMWLDRMGGDVGGVIKAIDDCMADEADRGRKAPACLSFYNGVIHRFMAEANKPATLTAFTAGKPFAGPAKTGAKAPWLEVYEMALENGWSQEANQIMAFAEASVDEANALAESVRGRVSAKKERAAA